MKRFIPLFVALLAGSPAGAASVLLDGRAALSPRPGEILVLLRDDVSPSSATSLHSAVVSGVLARHGLNAVPLAHVSRGPRVVRLVSDRPDFDPRVAADELRATGEFRAVTPNYRGRLFITIPNDPYVLPEQWYIQSPTDHDVDLPEAWDVTHGDTSVVIGIADTGVDLGHPDLFNKIWRNWGEIPGNSLDDDGNGYVDDVNGWDFGDDDPDPNPHPVFDEVSGIDVGFHGTTVAGIAAAATNNGTGMAGAGWNSRIMPLKVVDQAGQITVESVTAAYLYAADNGAEVLNLSLGFYAEPGLAEFFQALANHADSLGVAIVAAAGNDADSARIYPAGNARVIAVAATDDAGNRASFSNWGTWVDIAAPGQDMLSAICRNYEVDEFSQIYYLFFGWDEVNPYMYSSGTSMSCPLVAGTAALVRARWHRPGSLWMEQQLKVTGETKPFDLPIGKYLSAMNAVTFALDVPEAIASGVSLSAPSPNPSHERVTLGFTLPEAASASLRILDIQGRVIATLADGTFGAGPHPVEWNGRGPDGRQAESGVYFAQLLSGSSRAIQRIAFVH